MKNILVMFLVIAFIVSCNKTEVINTDFGEYYKLGEVDRGPITINKNKKNPWGVFWDAIREINEKDLIDNSKKLYPNEKYEYKAYISEKGNLDKIVIIKGMGKDADELVINSLKTLKFEPAIKNSKPVKFVMSYEYDGMDYLEFAEKMPEPIGGVAGISKLVDFPESAKKAGIEGKVFLQALINEKGEVDSVVVMRSVGYGCDEAAVKAVKMTKFIPAENDGKQVKSKVVIPIYFKLQ